MRKDRAFLALLGACIGMLAFLWLLWALAPFLMLIIGIIGVFMLLGYLKEKLNSDK